MKAWGEPSSARGCRGPCMEGSASGVTNPLSSSKTWPRVAEGIGGRPGRRAVTPMHGIWSGRRSRPRTGKGVAQGPYSGLCRTGQRGLPDRPWQLESAPRNWFPNWSKTQSWGRIRPSALDPAKIDQMLFEVVGPQEGQLFSAWGGRFSHKPGEPKLSRLVRLHRMPRDSPATVSGRRRSRPCRRVPGIARERAPHRRSCHLR